jgi:hypothetical protein
MTQPGSKHTSEQPATDPLSEIFPLLGEKVTILHGPSAEEPYLSGSDIDCGVIALDQQWPLRMRGGWRLCQFLRYDLQGWFWSIEREGQVVNLDTLDDPRGLGRDAFRTTLLRGQELHASPALRAAYLTAKRLRKGITTADEWKRISTLARQDPEGYAGFVREIVGPRSGPGLVDAVLAGRQPEQEIASRARREQYTRRFGSPARTAAASAIGLGRVLHRLLAPTGLFILVVGPDGTGKSTLTDALPDLLGGAFRRWLSFHWRPGLLPRPGRLIGREGSDPQTPHARSSYGPILSSALLGYYWLDFLVGGWLRIWPIRARTGMVVVERGWWDLAVDPRRYRLKSPRWLVRALGFWLVQPDLVLLLEAPPDTILRRKSEISKDEIERQTSTWESVLPARVPLVRVDASRPSAEVAAEAREYVLQMLERRAVARLGAGWSKIPNRSSARWVLPRGPKDTAGTGLTIYHPVTTKGRLAWETARLAAAVGGLRFLPKTEPPPRSVREMLASHIPQRGTLAVAKANHEGRFIAMILDGEGRCSAVAKVATSDEGASALDREAGSIERFREHLRPPVAAPTILEQAPGLLLFEPISWRPRRRAWRLDDVVAGAMGAFFRSSRVQLDGPDLAGAAHGDWTPWNMLWTDAGWFLIDWEDASDTAPPFFDLCHHMVQSHSLLGHPTHSELVRGFRYGDAWVGSALRAYAREADLQAADGESSLISYLRSTEGPRRGGKALAARRTLLARLTG